MQVPILRRRPFVSLPWGPIRWMVFAISVLSFVCVLSTPAGIAGDDPEARTENMTEASDHESATSSNGGDKADSESSKKADKSQNLVYPLAVLVIGIVVVLGLIIGLKLNAFLALITAAIVVSLLAEGSAADKISRTAEAFGSRAGQIGLVIAMAAVIGKCMLDSGAADRIVRTMLGIFGDRLAPLALMASGFILAIPVFFDTVFYLLVPLARSLHRRTGKNYLLYLLAIAAGGAITHTLVPPTPGPTAMASELGFSLGTMILIGSLVAAPAALVGVVFAILCDRWMPLPMRALPGESEAEQVDESELPPLWLSLAPVVLPVALISVRTILKATVPNPTADLVWLPDLFNILGNPNFALLISTAIALGTLSIHRGMSRVEMSKLVEISLMSGGVIILITAAGGAFGDMLKTAGVGNAISAMFGGNKSGGLDPVALLFLGFSLAALLKVAQGSSTVAMITGSAMMADLAGGVELSYHAVYLACSIGAGSLIGSWMNDSGFWIFAKMGGLTEVESLKSWTILLIVMGTVSFAVTVTLAMIWPFPLGGH